MESKEAGSGNFGCQLWLCESACHGIKITEVDAFAQSSSLSSKVNFHGACLSQERGEKEEAGEEPEKSESHGGSLM